MDSSKITDGSVNAVKVNGQHDIMVKLSNHAVNAFWTTTGWSVRFRSSKHILIIFILRFWKTTTALTRKRM